MKVNKIVKSTVEEELEITGAMLLSAEEAEKYLTHKERIYDSAWGLCSPCYDCDCAAYVGCSGYTHNYFGVDVDYEFGVRPALQIKNLESSNLKIGDTFEIGDYEFKVISENLAWMFKQDIGRCEFNKYLANGNNYETSDVKKFVDKWFRLLMFNESEER